MRSGRENLQTSLRDIQRHFRIALPDYPVFSQSCAQSLLKIHAFPDFVKHWYQSAKQFEMIMKAPHCGESQAYLISLSPKIQSIEERLKEWRSCLDDLFLLRMGKALRPEVYRQTIVQAIECAYDVYEESHEVAMNHAIKTVQGGIDCLLGLNSYREQLNTLAENVKKVKAELDALTKSETKFGESIGRMSPGFYEALYRESIFSQSDESDDDLSQSFSMSKFK